MPPAQNIVCCQSFCFDPGGIERTSQGLSKPHGRAARSAEWVEDNAVRFRCANSESNAGTGLGVVCARITVQTVLDRQFLATRKLSRIDSIRIPVVCAKEKRELIPQEVQCEEVVHLLSVSFSREG